MQPDRKLSAEVMVMILAGGEGKRLYPLTKERAKPAVPFGGRYRIIDFVLSNFVNSGFFKIKVLTQFKSDSLNVHLSQAWRLSPLLNHYVDPVPAQMRMGPSWYKGTADAVYQNIHLIFNEKPDYVCVFGGDHIYMMDIRQMLEHHIEMGADVTVSGLPVPLEQVQEFGIIEADEESRIIGFQEKPKVARSMPGKSGYAIASMGNYIFNTDTMISELEKDALRDSSHDFGKTILPEIFKEKETYLYDFARNAVPGTLENQRGYWRDVGSIDAYWRASMDLVSVSPILNLYNDEWPIRTALRPNSAAKFVFADKERKRMGIATDSMVSEGCIISGGHINRTILSPKVKINSYSYVTDSILFNRVNIGRYAQIRKAIIDKGVDIPPGTRIGYDLEEDRKRFTVSRGGVVVVPKGTKF